MLKAPLSRLTLTTQHLLPRARSAAMTSSTNPTGLIAKSGIELLTWMTPNGHKASILLEELKAAYGMEYTFQAVNIGDNVQKEKWFTDGKCSFKVQSAFTNLDVA